MPSRTPAQRIAHHRERAAHFARLARERHYRAAVLARWSLSAQKQGRPVQARRLMQQALQVKAAAGRASLRSQHHWARIAAIRQSLTEARRRREAS
jgi:hypothetical protein